MTQSALRHSWLQLIRLEEHVWQLTGNRDPGLRKREMPYWFRMSREVHDPRELLRRYANDSML